MPLYRQIQWAAHNICNLRYKTPEEIPVIFHSWSNYVYHFITKLLAGEFEGQFKCLGENTENYITFSVPIEKQEHGKVIKYKIRFINSVRFMARSLSSLDVNLAEGLRKDKCKDCRSGLEYMTSSDGLLIFKCVDFNKTYEKNFDEDLLKRFKTLTK